MKKSRLFRLLLSATLPLLACAGAVAQTQNNPLDFTLGSRNSYTGNESQTYWQFTPGTDGLVKLDIGISGLYEGDINTPVKGFYTYDNYDGDSSSAFLVKGGEKYIFYISKWSWGVIDYTFTGSLSRGDSDPGYEISRPINVPLGDEILLPTYGESESYYAPTVYTPVYAKCTSNLNGVLDITLTDTPHSVGWAEYVEGKSDYTFTPLSAARKLAINVESEKSYIFCFEGESGNLATFATRVPTPGASRSDAWQAVEGENEIPAAAGSYWYKYTAPSSGYLTILSDANATLWADDIVESSYSNIRSINKVALHEKFYSADGIVFKITKTEATATPESFTLTFGAGAPTDSESTAPQIEADKLYNTPIYGGGDYYYAIDAPESGAYFCDVAIQSDNNDVRCALKGYDNNYDYYSTLVSGSKSIHYAVQPGAKLVVMIHTPLNESEVPFKVTFTEVEPGETLTNPIAAAEGDNTLKAGSTIYYTITAPENEWMVLNLPTGVKNPSVYLKTDRYSNPESFTANAETGYDAATKYRVESGKEYVLEFSDVVFERTFNIAFRPYEVGEDASTAFEVKANGEGEIPGETGQFWYVYTAQRTGYVVVGTTLPYSGIEGVNRINIYLNTVSSNTRRGLSTEYMGGEYVYTPLKVSVMAGDKVYASIDKVNFDTGTVLQFMEEDALPGETPGSAIRVELENGEATASVPKIESYGGQKVYYVVHLTPGVFNIVSRKYMSAEIFNNPDCLNGTYSTQYYYDGQWVYGFNTTINTEGDYYIRFNSMGTQTDKGPFDVDFYLREPEPGESAATALVIDVPEEQEEFEYTFEKVPYEENRWYRIQLFKGVLEIVSDRTIESASYTERAATVATEGFIFRGSLYSESDFNTPIASTVNTYSPESTTLTATIETPGQYYFRLSELYVNGVVSISGTALKDPTQGVDTLEGGRFAVICGYGTLTATGYADTLCVYDLQGHRLAATHLDGTAQISLPAGVYVISDGTHTLKALVK